MIAPAKAHFSAIGAATVQRTGHRAFATRAAALRAKGSSARSAGPRGLPARAGGSALALALLVLLLTAAPAMAGQAHVFKSSFGSSGSGSGQFNENNENAGIAVDQSTGDVYVADEQNHRVEKFDASGKFILMFGKEVDQTTGANVCTAASGDTCKAGVSTTNPGSLIQPTFIAVDNSAGPSAGDVYVADSTNHVVSKFNSSGNLISAWGSGGQLGSSPGKKFQEFAGIAVDSTGTLYVLEQSRMFEFEQDGTFIKEFEPAFGTENSGTAVDSAGDIYKVRESGAVAKLDPSGASLIETVDPGPATGIAVDPATDQLYVVHADHLSRYSSSGTLLEVSFGSSHITNATGVAVKGSSGRAYVSDTGASAVEIFDPVPVPDVSTGSASAITSSTAALSGHLDPAGTGEVTGCRFEYGTETSYGQTAPCSPLPPYSEPADVSTELSGLSSSTEYHYRLVVENANGEAGGQDRTFHTPYVPFVNAAFANPIGETTANLLGQINPEGAKTEYQFEYSTSPTGPFTSTGTQTLPFEDEEFHFVEAEATGLQPRTTYYWRLTATNEAGTTTNPSPEFQHFSHFETTGPPNADTFPAHSFRGETIHVTGAVVSHNFDTHYHFEYVSQEKFEAGEFTEAASTPELDAGSAERGSFIVGQDLPGLQAGATYHFRLVATNTAAGNPVILGNEETLTVPTPVKAEGEETCPNAQFRTGPSAHLPDCRAYEQVTPAEKAGSQDNYAGGPSITVPGYDGDHVLLETFSKFGKDVNPTVATAYLFSRTPSGWQTSSDAPQPQTADNTHTILPLFFTPNLSNFLLTSRWVSTIFNGSHEVEFMTGPIDGPYTKVASSDVGAGGFFFEATKWIAQSRDGSTAILESEDHELLGHPTGTTSNRDLYEFSQGQLRQLNLLGGGETIGTCGAQIAEGLETHGQGATHVSSVSHSGSINSVSAEGSRVFFEAYPNECPSEQERDVGGPNIHVYMRLNGKQTVDVGAYKFEGANPQGTSLFLSKVNGETLEFFSYDTEAETAKHLFSIKEGASGDNKISQVGEVISEDGNVFYFETEAQLTPEAPPLVAQSGLLLINLYRYDIETESMSYIGQPDQGESGYYTSPDGRYFYWDSSGNSEEAVPGVPGGGSELPQAYRYDSVENVVQCISCASPFNPEPALRSVMFVQDGPIRDRPSPLGMPASANGDYVFFAAQSELVPRDVNGEVVAGQSQYESSPSSDVYEWRKNGVDGCAHVQGCLALISSGIDGTKNEVLGTTPSGRDVFIGTHSQLVPSDADTSGDLYDVRIGGGYPPPPPRPVECEGDACSTPANPPNDPTPSSSTYHGPGNEHPVNHKHHKKHHKHKKTKKHHKRSHKRTGHNHGGHK